MKIRIKSHSVRFRFSPEDLERFIAEGETSEETCIPVPGGAPVVFRCTVRKAEVYEEESLLVARPFGFDLRLSRADAEALLSEEHDGVYVRREWQNAQGRPIRFLAYVEKDKKAKKHKKKHHEKDKTHDNG